MSLSISFLNQEKEESFAATPNLNLPEPIKLGQRSKSSNNYRNNNNDLKQTRYSEIPLSKDYNNIINSTKLNRNNRNTMSMDINKIQTLDNFTSSIMSS